MPARDYERVLGANLWGVTHGTKAFLPRVIASGDGHVALPARCPRVQAAVARRVRR